MRAACLRYPSKLGQKVVDRAAEDGRESDQRFGCGILVRARFELDDRVVIDFRFTCQVIARQVLLRAETFDGSSDFAQVVALFLGGHRQEII